MIQTGAMALFASTRFFPSLPNCSTTARKFSIFSLLRATYCPTSSMTNTMAFPGLRRAESSNVRSTRVLMVISAFGLKDNAQESGAG